MPKTVHYMPPRNMLNLLNSGSIDLDSSSRTLSFSARLREPSFKMPIWGRSLTGARLCSMAPP